MKFLYRFVCLGFGHKYKKFLVYQKTPKYKIVAKCMICGKIIEKKEQ